MMFFSRSRSLSQAKPGRGASFRQNLQDALQTAFESLRLGRIETGETRQLAALISLTARE